MPFGKSPHALPKLLTQDWNLAGITRFATGFPISLRQGQDQSLVGSGSTDVPNLVGNVQTQDSRNPGPNGANTYFLPDAFASGRLGHFGTSNRRFFHGPGIVNWDCAVMKDTRITEKTALQFRAEFFNILNHAQFHNPNGNFSSGIFGVVTSTRDPRIGQMSLKFLW